MPKKKGGKKGPKIVDGVATSEMTREQLVGHVRRIQVKFQFHITISIRGGALLEPHILNIHMLDMLIIFC